jgi:uncharacterized protein YkwD
MRYPSIAVLAIGLILAAGLCGAPAQEKKASTKFELTDREKEMLKLINEARAAAKVLPVRPHPTLFRIAREHSAQMAKQGKLTGVIDGKTLQQRVKAAGYVFHKVSHKLTRVDTSGGGEVSLPNLVKEWAAAKTARDYVLGRSFLEVGLGVTDGPNGVYFTALFALPRID